MTSNIRVRNILLTKNKYKLSKIKTKKVSSTLRKDKSKSLASSFAL